MGGAPAMQGVATASLKQNWGSNRNLLLSQICDASCVYQGKTTYPNMHMFDMTLWLI
jgi:hypothetical protein